jgi:uncharacterized protein (TIGR02757 family)
MNIEELKPLLDAKVAYYNQPSFIKNDPISIPHSFSKLQDIEIAAFWTAMLSWGQRKTIINKAKELMDLMDHAPHDFVLNHQESDLKSLLSFKHRTFQPDDTLYFISFFKHYYNEHRSLEDAFIKNGAGDAKSILSDFHDTFFSLPDMLNRTKKHVSTPVRRSACKRLNMFLRWMVRKDDARVDFGLWEKISPAILMIPLDVHVFKISKHLGLLKRTKSDWQAVEELTTNLRLFDNQDPVKYDYALFSMGVLEKR